MNNRKYLNQKWNKNKGAIVVMLTIALPALILIVGLAIDSGRAYGVKAKLSSAVDAAALAAARAVANGEAKAIITANKFFDANYPAGYLESSVVGRPQVTFSYSSEGDVRISVSAKANMPTSFVKLAGVDNMDIDSSAETIRRVVDLSLVVDNTTSLQGVTQEVKNRSKDFIGNFNQNFDRIALVKYAFGAEVPVTFGAFRGFSKTTINNEIDAFEFGGNGLPAQYTNASEGMWRAIDELDNATDPASLRVIVFFTDGAPNTFSSRFSFNRRTADHVGSIRSGDGSSGTPVGLWEVDKVAEKSPAPWNLDSRDNYIYDRLAGLPQHYNAHDQNATDFKIINEDHPRRRVTDFSPRGRNRASRLYTKVNRVARNLPEDMAEYAREKGIYVLTLGLGDSLTQQTGPDRERGDEMLIRMANDPSMLDIPALANDFNPNQPQGLYCHAVDKDALAPCFSDMLAVIIRLTL